MADRWSVGLLALSGTLLMAALTAEPLPASETDDGPPVTTVDVVDLERYAGLWYEIARIPNRFQKQCASGTTAEYSLRGDGRIRVVNRCLEDDGHPDEAEGVAKVVESSGNAKLEVSFVSFLGWRPFWGDYWIIGLDDDYRWAVVGTPDRAYGWLLARTPTLDDETMSRIDSILEQNGYDRTAFEPSPQTGALPTDARS